MPALRHSKPGEWDAVAERDWWEAMARNARESHKKLFPKPPSTDSKGFYALCLVELDAIEHIVEHALFSSEADFDAAWRELLAKPTQPSDPSVNLDAYRSSQSTWIRFVLGELRSKEGIVHSRKMISWISNDVIDNEWWLALIAFGFLAIACFVLQITLDGNGERWIGLSAWHGYAAFMTFIILFFHAGHKSEQAYQLKVRTEGKFPSDNTLPGTLPDDPRDGRLS